MRALLLLIVVSVAAGCGSDGTRGGPSDDGSEPAAPASLSVTSPAFGDGEDIPLVHTCDGDDQPVPLGWEGVDPDAVEVVVVVDDPDAPGGTFTHWLVAGLPAQDDTIDGALTAGAVEGRNDFGDQGWSGPCPPPGDDPHRYRFQVIAMGEPTGLESGFARTDLDAAVAGSGLAAGVLEGRYGR